MIDSPLPSPLARWLLITGILGPVLFTIVFTVDGLLKPGYSATQMAISYLEVGSYGWVQHANFAMIGVLLVGFARAMRWVTPSRARVWAAGFLALSGAGYLVASLFPPAPFGQPQTALVPTLHTVAFEMVFFGLGLAAVTMALPLIKTRGWRGYGWYSLVTGGVLLIPPLVNLLPSQQAVFSNPQHFQFGGLFNRVVLAIAFVWYVVIAVRLLRQSQLTASRHGN